ncbi:MAG TPA: hypothetical protein VIK86_00390 [Candidatus Paceibacterota bacterium]
MLANQIYTNSIKTDFTFALSSFLDEFYRSDNKEILIKDEPIYEKGFEKENSIIASVVHKLANDYTINVPQWVHNKKYILAKPYYQFDTTNKEYQEYLIDKSPMEFKQRNIYVDDNALKRV